MTKSKSLLLVVGLLFGAARAAAFQVVDSGGRVIGETFSGASSEVLRRTEDGTVVSLIVTRSYIHPTTFEALPQVSFLYETVDCSGTPFLITDELVQISHGVSAGGLDRVTTLYYAAQPVQTRTLRSVTNSQLSGGCSGEGCMSFPDGSCCCPTTLESTAGPAGTIDLGVFTPPYRVE